MNCVGCSYISLLKFYRNFACCHIVVQTTQNKTVLWMSKLVKDHLKRCSDEGRIIFRSYRNQKLILSS